VSPGSQVQVIKAGEFGQAQAGGDMAAGVLADGQLGELIGRGDPAVEGAGALGGLGGVFGDVRGDSAVGEVPVAVMGRVSSWRPQASVRAGIPEAAGI